MDEKKFKQELSKIAKWYTPKVSDGWSGSSRKPKPDDPDYQPNEHLGPVIEELITAPTACGACGRICHQFKTHRRSLRKPFGWFHHCNTCSKPLVGENGPVKENKPEVKSIIQTSDYWSTIDKYLSGKKPD